MNQKSYIFANELIINLYNLSKMKKVVLSLAAVALLTAVSCKDANAEVEATNEEVIEAVEETVEDVQEEVEATTEEVEETIEEAAE